MMTHYKRVVVLAAGLVYVLSSNCADAVGKKALPVLVAELHALMLSASKTGNLDEFKTALEASPSTPDFGHQGVDDVAQVLHAESTDKNGREALAALSEILELQPAALPLGRDLENNLVYVWPYLATKPLDVLSATEEIDLYRIVPTAKILEMREKKRWLWWRVEIGADGRLLSLKKHN